MASFSNLHASRQTKESKSYVSSSPNVQKSSTSLPFQPSPEGPTVVASSEEFIHSLPSSVDIRTTATSGRGLWANKTMKPGKFYPKIDHNTTRAYKNIRSGEAIVSNKPHIAVLSNQYLDSYCSNCFGSPTETGLKRCTTCRTVWYCDSVCLFACKLLMPLRDNLNSSPGVSKQRLATPQTRMPCPSSLVKICAITGAIDPQRRC